MKLITRFSTITLSLLLACPFVLQPSPVDGQWAFEAERQDRDRDRDKDRSRDRDRSTDWNRSRDRDRSTDWDRNRERDRVIILRKPQWEPHRYPNYRSRTTIIVPRDRFVWGTRVIRPYGHRYHGYGFFFSDDDAFKWLAFTAITLKILDNLNEEQQRLHEAAQVRATTANVGETIIWEEGNASGAVTTTRIGTSSTGRPCREFQQSVTIGGKTEQAYGTACMNPDGSWEVVP